MESIIAVAPTDRGDIFRLKVSADLCVGPAGHVFLFGGAGLGGAIAAMEQCSGRKLICATAQYLSYARARSEEHTSELQSLMRISYAVFCLKKKTATTL